MASDRQPLPVGAGDKRACRPGFQRHGNQQSKDAFRAFEFNPQQVLFIFAEVLQCVTCQVFPKIAHGKVKFLLTWGLICDCMWTFFLRLMPVEQSTVKLQVDISRLPLGADVLALVFP